MKDEIKKILEKFNKEVEKAELTRNPYSSEDKKFKHILVSLSEEHFNIFKDILDYIANLQEENEKVHKDFDELSERYFFTKSRNEKVIKCIKDKYYKEEYERKGTFANKLMNILQGDDEE